MICFWNKRDDQSELDASPYQRHIKRPSPVGILIDKPTHEWANFRTASVSSQLKTFDALKLGNVACSSDMGRRFHGYQSSARPTQDMFPSRPQIPVGYSRKEIYPLTQEKDWQNILPSVLLGHVSTHCLLARFLIWTYPRARPWKTYLNTIVSSAIMIKDKYAKLRLTSNSASGNAQKCGAGKPVEKSRHKHRGHVVRHCRRYDPNNEHGIRVNVDGSAAVELRIWAHAASVNACRDLGRHGATVHIPQIRGRESWVLLPIQPRTS